MPDVRNKETICATVSPYIKKQIEELVMAKEFSSMSDFVSIAVTKFLEEFKLEKKLKREQQAQKSELTRPVTIE